VIEGKASSLFVQREGVKFLFPPLPSNAKTETGITLLPNFLMQFPKWTRPERTALFQAFNVRASPLP